MDQKQFTCPKCGKVITMSVEALINMQYHTVCPQCLSRLDIVGDYAYIPIEGEPSITGSADTPPTPEPAQPTPPPFNTDKAVEDVEAVDVTNQPPPTPPVIPPVPNMGNGVDPLMGEAVKFLSQCTAITPVMLRDHLNISLERAQQLMQQLEKAGIVGPYNHGGPRSILIPHRQGLPHHSAMPTAENYDDATTDDKPRHKSFSVNCSGCFMWLLVSIFITMLLRTCT